MNLEKKDSDSGLLLINAKGNLWASTKGSFCWTTLLNFSRWIRDGGGHGYVKRDGCSLRGEIGVSSIHSLFEEDEVGISLFPVKEIGHSFSPILGLALVSLVLMCLGMTSSRSYGVCWTVLAHFGQGQPGLQTFSFGELFVKTPGLVHQSHSGSSSFVVLMFQLQDT